MSGFLVVGEALIDVVCRADGSSAEFAGGSPANVALGLSRLGNTTQLLTRIGDDERGRGIAEHQRSNNVTLTEGSITEAETSTAIATLDEAGVASYEFNIDWTIPPVDARTLNVDTVHTGSIAAFLQPGGDQVMELLRQARSAATISYDPNARPRLMGDATAARARVESIIALCDVVKVSDEDLEWLAPGEDIETVARSWQAMGPALVIVTRGGDGAVAVTANHRCEAAAPKITVADTVGAGDAFTAGLLDFLAGLGLLGAGQREALAQIEASQLQALLAQAVKVSALTCTRQGANPPTREDLDAWSG